MCYFKLLSFFMIMFVLTGFSQENVKTVSLFDGTSLNGWETVNLDNQKFWSVIDSVITGGDGIQRISENTYLHTTELYENFEFRCLFRLTGDTTTGFINSGIQYRSIISDSKIIGYQADIGEGYWGDIYDEHRRSKLVGGDLSILKLILNGNGWNSYIVRCIGNKHELYINGIKTSEYFEQDPKIPSIGVIGIQLHSGGNAKVEFKHLTITQL